MSLGCSRATAFRQPVKSQRTAIRRAVRSGELGLQPRRSNGLKWDLFLLGAILLMVGLVVAAVLAALGLIYQSDLIMPGVQVSGIALGAKPTAEAIAVLERSWQDQTIQLGDGATTGSVSAANLGIVLDSAATVRRAHQEGRSLDRVEALLQGDWTVDISPIWALDADTAEEYLRESASQFAVPATNAGVRMVNGGVEPTPAIPGRAMDVAASVIFLGQNLDHIVAEGRFQPTTLPVQPEITDVRAALAEANQLLTNSLSLRAYDPISDETINWDVEPAVWGRWLYVGVTRENPPRLLWELDTQEVSAFLVVQAATLIPDRYLDLERAVAAVMEAAAGRTWQASFRIYHYPGQHTVRSGDTLASIGREHGMPYPWIQQANPNIGDTLHVGDVLTVPSPDEFLPLPIIEGKRIVISISQQRLWAYEGGALKWEWLVSTGIDSSPTAPGVFQVQTHEMNAYAASWDLWMPYFMGIYRPVPTADFMNGFHGFPTRSGSQLLWTSNLGRPITYGCILLAQENAAALYEWAPEGTLVEIRP